MRQCLTFCALLLLVSLGCSSGQTQSATDRINGRCVPTTEICNNIDDNCDGEIDEGFQLATDPKNCGSCERRCGNGQKCQNGHCAYDQPISACISQQEECNGEDDDCDKVIDNGFDLTTDRTNCGICGRRCASGQTCADSHCSQTVDPDTCVSSAEICNGKDDDCDGKVDEDFNLLSDASNCGICQRQCDVDTDCVNGRCTLQTTSPLCVAEEETCNGKDDDCDGQVDDSFDLLSDHDNCGICGRACLASQKCANGHCEERGQVTTCVTAPETCNNEDDDCDGIVDDGFDLLSDANNCGICGRQCGTGQTCRNGRCTNTSVSSTCQPKGETCNNEDDNCDGIVDDGFDLLSDPKNCGVCGRLCGAQQECRTGRCAYTQPVQNCQSSTEVCDNQDNDCDGVVDDGFDLLTDMDNCGSCGVSCADGEACNSGRCGADFRLLTGDTQATFTLNPDVIVLPEGAIIVQQSETPCEQFDIEYPPGVLPATIPVGWVVAQLSDGGVACRVSSVPGSGALLPEGGNVLNAFSFSGIVAKLEDVFLTFSVDKTIPLNALLSPSTSLTLNAEYTKNNKTLTIRSGITEMSVQWAGSVRVQVNVERAKLKLIRMTYTTSVETKMKGGIEFAGEASGDVLPSKTFPILTVPLFAAPAPIPFALKGGVEVKLEPLQVTGTLNFSMQLAARSVRSTVTVIEKREGQDWMTSRSTTTPSWLERDVGANFARGLSSKLDIVPHVDFLILGLAGPSLQAKAGVEAGLSIPLLRSETEVAHVYLKGCVSLGCIARADFFGVKLAEVPLISVESCATIVNRSLEDCHGGDCCSIGAITDLGSYKPPGTACSAMTTTYTCEQGTGCGADITAQTRASKTCLGTSPYCVGPTGPVESETTIPCGATTACSEGSRTCVSCNSCSSNYCQTNGYSSGSYCSGSDAVSCGMSGSCKVETARTPCSSGCSTGSCVSGCTSNYCQNNNYSSGTYCSGADVVTCGTFGSCKVEVSRSPCAQSCSGSSCVSSCTSNYCQNGGYSSGSYCLGSDAITCGTNGSCKVETSRTTCSRGCSGGSCNSTPGCGGIGDACCSGSTCNSPLVCSDSVCTVYAEAGTAKVYNGSGVQATPIAGCTNTAAAGWHDGTGANGINIRWAPTTTCSVPSASNVRSYSGYRATWDLSIPKDGYYEIAVKAPNTGYLCNSSPSTRYASEVYYGLDRVGADGDLVFGPADLNSPGQWVTLTTWPIHLAAGTHTLLLYDHGSTATGSCSSGTSSKWVMVDSVKAVWAFE